MKDLTALSFQKSHTSSDTKSFDCDGIVHDGTTLARCIPLPLGSDIAVTDTQHCENNTEAFSTTSVPFPLLFFHNKE